jgi:hypothetical protein
MRILQRKLAHYTEPQKVEKMGIYPFFRMIESDQDTVVTMNGKKVLMFGSNSYLGLTNHPKIKEAAIKATEKYGTGCAGSRFLNGTLDIHIELETKLAEFVGKQAGSCRFLVKAQHIPDFNPIEDDGIGFHEELRWCFRRVDRSPRFGEASIYDLAPRI